MSVHLCKFLRWKSLYGRGLVDEAALLEMWARNEVPYSCLRTCQTAGPDDDIAAPEACTPARSCYEASPRLVHNKPVV